MWSLTGKFHGTPVKAAGDGFEFDGVPFKLAVVGLEPSRFSEDGDPIWGVVLDSSALNWPEKISGLLDLLVRLAILEEDDIPF